MPLALYGIGLVLIFAGIVWAALTRRARSLHTLKDASGKSLVHTLSDAELEIEDGRRGGRRGVGALFSSDIDSTLTGREYSKRHPIPRKFIVGVAEWCIGLLLYSGLVEQYNSNVYMRSWVHSSFPFAEFLLNFYAFIAIDTLITIAAISILLRNLHAAQTLEQE